MVRRGIAASILRLSQKVLVRKGDSDSYVFLLIDLRYSTFCSLPPRHPSTTMTALIHDLPSAWHVDQACMSEDERVVIIRFGDPKHKDTWAQDEMLYKIADKVRNFAVIYTCDNTQIQDFNQMYELYDVCTVMFFWRNKHMMCDFGTGNNNKLNFYINDKQDLIDIIEVIYRGAKKGRGLVVSPKDYSTHYKY